MQSSSRGGRHAEEQADPRRHGDRGQPVPPLHRDPPGACDGQVAEDEQQLERQDGLDQGQCAIVQGTELEGKPEDHARDADQPDRPAGQAEDEPDIKGRRLIAPGAEALAHRSGGRTEARRDGQQECLFHQSRSAPLAALQPACTSAGRDIVMEPAQRVSVSTRIASGCTPLLLRSGSGCARSGQATFRAPRAAA